MIGRRDLAAAGVLAAAVFSAAWTLSRFEPRLDVGDALATVVADREATVCLGEEECLSPEAEHTLFVFLRAGDCAGGLYDAAVLDGVFRATGRARLNIVGVVDRMTVDEARAFAVASGISYPLYADPAGLERAIGNPRAEPGNRPVKLLVDRRGNRVREWKSVPHIATLRREADQLRAEFGGGGS